MKPCPKCGKPMLEEPKWPGLWRCPDYSAPINTDGPPFFYKCRGMEVTEEASEAFHNEMHRIIAERN